MTSTVVLDTCILIDHLRGRNEARQYLRGFPDPPFVSAVTIAELYAGLREGGERAVLEALLTLFRVVQGGYYGHPNPYRSECVFGDGSFQGVAPLPNYQPALYDLGDHRSANGIYR